MFARSDDAGRLSLFHPVLFITSIVSLFVIVDPPGNIFPYLSLSAGVTPGTARALAGRACLYSFVILTLFVGLGRLVLKFFGISLPAFQIAGGLVLFRIAFDMMEGRGHFNRLDTSTSLAPGDYRDIAIIPLAMPLLSGPGAISTVLVLTARSKNLLDDALLVSAIGLILLLTYILFCFAAGVMGVLKESGLRLLTRLMGLILAALAAEFVITGIKTAFPSLS